MSKRLLQVALFCDATQFASLKEIDFHVWFFAGISDAVEGSTSGVLSLHRETKFIIGLNFDATLSSPESFCVPFHITSEQSVELKRLMLNKHKWWFITCEISLGQSASWFLVSMYLIWILGSKLIRSNNQSRATLWVLETCFIVGLLPLNDRFDHCFFVFKHIQQSFLIRRLDVWGNKINMIHIIGHSLSVLAFVNRLRWRTSSLWFVHKSQPCLITLMRVFPRTAKIRSHKSQSCVQRDDFGFCWSVRNGSLFFTHPTVRNKCMTSKKRNVPPGVEFESSRCPAKSGVLKQSQSRIA